jgi:hypothetical protein
VVTVKPDLDALNYDVGSVCSQSTEVTNIPSQHRPAWLGRCDDDGVDGRASSRQSAQSRGPARKAFWQAFDDVTGFQETIGYGVCALAPGQRFDQHH